MRKLAVLALALLLVPSAFAVVAQTFQVPMQTSLVTQGYAFARVQGFNHNDVPVNVMHWHLTALLGLSHAFCELQPVPLPPGSFTVDIAVQCQTRSSFTTLFPTGTKVAIEVFSPDGTKPASFVLDKLWVETRAKVPTPFPITPIAGEAVLEEQSSTAGTFLFVAGMAAIVVLTLVVLLFSLRRDE